MTRCFVAERHSSAAACPPEPARADRRPYCTTGTGAYSCAALDSVPSCPFELLPQHHMLPSLRSPHTCDSPGWILVKSLMPNTGTAKSVVRFVPLPNSKPLEPQHHPVPVPTIAHMMPKSLPCAS